MSLKQKVEQINTIVHGSGPLELRVSMSLLDEAKAGSLPIDPSGVRELSDYLAHIDETIEGVRRMTEEAEKTRTDTQETHRETQGDTQREVLEKGGEPSTDTHTDGSPPLL